MKSHYERPQENNQNITNNLVKCLSYFFPLISINSTSTKSGLPDKRRLSRGKILIEDSGNSLMMRGKGWFIRDRKPCLLTQVYKETTLLTVKKARYFSCLKEDVEFCGAFGEEESENEEKNFEKVSCSGAGHDCAWESVLLLWLTSW